MNKKYVIGVIALICLMSFSAVLAVYVISGMLLFIGLVALCESIRPLKWLLSKSGNVLDIIIFGFSIYAMSSMGVTVAIGLGVAGLLYSVYYKPYLIKSFKARVKKKPIDVKSNVKEYRAELWKQ